MTLTTGDFPAFFAAVNGASFPFAWQRRLLQHVVEHGRWPDVIAAPTGSGKSNVVDIHVFANALWGVGVGPRVPRRLATVVNRRALVDNQADRARLIKSQLEGATSGVLLEVREALATLAPGADDFLELGLLRGGLAVDSGWLDDPRLCAVICATPDMWGSRLLMRGYGSSPRAWPREAGLLACDSVIVLDEAHLNRQLLLTARTVSRLNAPHAERLGVPTLNVVETTATPAALTSDASMVAVTEDDLDRDAVLAARLKRPKPVQYTVSDHWPTKGTAAASHIDLLTEEILRLRAETQQAGTIGCIVNRVDTAVRVADSLAKKGLSTGCWVGRLRPLDLGEFRDANPELFDSSQQPRLDVLVATQTVEVGVDLDLHGLVTELASGSALAQRAGRVNRRGLRPEGAIVVTGPVPDGTWTDALPYLADDLQRAYEWVHHLTREDGGMCPWNLTRIHPPVAAARRSMFKQPEPHDALRWSATSDAAFADEDLALWLRDDLSAEDQTCGLVLRTPLPEGEMDALALLQQTPPTDAETFPADISLIKAHAQRVFDLDGWVFRYRNDTIVRVDEPADFRPGDVILTDAKYPATLQGVMLKDPPDKPEPLRTYWGAGAEVIQTGHPDQHLLVALAGLSPEEAQQEYLALTGKADQVILPPPDTCTDDDLPWLVLRQAAVVNTDEPTRQEWTISTDPVGLADHCAAVSARAQRHANDLGLPAQVADVLEQAGLHHDDGKADPRFQQVLGADPGCLLAKSLNRNAQRARRGKSELLPNGWRHEHRSVVIAGPMLQDHPDSDLILRLVGTSHGWGRTLPNDTSQTITQPGVDDPDTVEQAGLLFDEGEWTDGLDRTHHTHGVWGCAYLEALLRAADCQVSREGS